MSKLFTVSNGRIGLNKFHRFHLLDLSQWPILTSAGLLFLVLGLVTTFYDTNELWFLHAGFSIKPNIFLLAGFSTVIICVVNWWSDVSRESTSGEHTKYVVRGLKFGMMLFIVSEVFFFLSFFWAFFHTSLSPGHEIGGIWPPVGFDKLVLEFTKIPLLNTILLLSSGVTVTYAHLCFNLASELEGPTYLELIGQHNLKMFNIIDCLRYRQALENKVRGAWAMYITLTFAIMFILLQALEYCEAYFNISDGIYGSTFFLMTGFHGLHVIVGTIFLVVSLYRIRENYFLGRHSTGLECAIWYWHFVDVVWLFLYISVYYWGNKYYLAENTNRIVGEVSTELITGVTTRAYYLDKLSELVPSLVVDADYAVAYEIGFQDPATTFMEKIFKLHDYIMLYLIFICFIFLAIVTYTIGPYSSLRTNNDLKEEEDYNL